MAKKMVRLLVEYETEEGSLTDSQRANAMEAYLNKAYDADVRVTPERHVVVWTTGGDDLSYEVFDTRESAEEFVTETEWKAVLITTDGAVLKIEDHT